MSDQRRWTNTEKLECAKRELGLRERVYPYRISKSKMTQQLANEQLSLMRAIVADYEMLAAGERLI